MQRVLLLSHHTCMWRHLPTPLNNYNNSSSNNYVQATLNESSCSHYSLSTLSYCLLSLSLFVCQPPPAMRRLIKHASVGCPLFRDRDRERERVSMSRERVLVVVALVFVIDSE